jgi:hypothetical protein
MKDKSYYENKRAKDLGIAPNKGSGAVNDDGDFRMGDFLIEHKYRNKNTIWANLSWWKKINKQAILKNRLPCIIFENERCSVAYFKFGDIDLLKHRFDLQIIRSSSSKWLKNDNYIARLEKARSNDKIYIIEYEPIKLMILEIEDFKEIISSSK